MNVSGNGKESIMGIGKKVARAKREMWDIKNEAVAELMAARKRDRMKYEEIARLRARLRVRAALALLALLCWAVTRWAC